MKVKESSLTKRMRAVSAMVNALPPAQQQDVAVCLNGIRTGIVGLGRMPKEVTDELMTILMDLFRKLLVNAALGRREEEGARLMEQVTDGLEGRLKELVYAKS